MNNQTTLALVISGQMDGFVLYWFKAKIEIIITNNIINNQSRWERRKPLGMFWMGM